MFENLSDRLQSVFSGLRGKGRLTEKDIYTRQFEGKSIDVFLLDSAKRDKKALSRKSKFLYSKYEQD